VGDAGAAWHSSLGTFLMKSGKWYWEVDVGSDADDVKVGVVAAGEYSGDIITADTDPGTIGYVLHCDASGAVYNAESSGGATGDDNLDAPAASDIMTVAFDADTGEVWFGLYNAGSGHVWGDFGASGVGDPANGTNPAFTISDVELYDFVPVIGVNAHSTLTANFGQSSFSGTQPTGFNALSTANLTEPVVRDPDSDDYCCMIEYEGDGAASQAITGVGFQPNYVWIKNRDAADHHQVFDSDRGATYPCRYNDGTPAEAADADTLLSFDADGFSVGADIKVNTISETYQALCLKKQSGFFDIQTYTGTGVAHAENHDLGVKPEMMIVWNRTDGREIHTYHFGANNKSSPEDEYARLDLSNAFANLNTPWDDTAPTTTQFTVGTGANTNDSGDEMVAWLFASKEGISKVFYYEGNGNANGPYVYCGFRPNFVMIKDEDTANAWMMYSARAQEYNASTRPHLAADIANAESPYATTEIIDLYANGFKVRNIVSRTNANASPYIGIAFSEQPFKYANAR
jgi:hypothetical protein